MEGSRTETLTEIKAAHIEIGKLRESIDRCHPEPTGRNQLINGIDIDTVFPYLSAVPELLKKIYSMDMLFEIAKGELPHLSERIHRLFSVSEKRLSKCKNEEQEEYVIHDISVQFDRLKASIVNLISCESDSKPDETENTSLRYRRIKKKREGEKSSERVHGRGEKRNPNPDPDSAGREDDSVGDVTVR